MDGAHLDRKDLAKLPEPLGTSVSEPLTNIPIGMQVLLKPVFSVGLSHFEATSRKNAQLANNDSNSKQVLLVACVRSEWLPMV
jgi:hypothetical protein